MIDFVAGRKPGKTSAQTVLNEIRAIRPGGLTTERLAELLEADVRDLQPILKSLKAQGLIGSYIASGLTFWKLTDAAPAGSQAP